MRTERRRTSREQTIERDVRCSTELSDGRVLVGLVADVSLGGARIHGSTEGVRVGEEVRLVFLFLTGEKVAYSALVIHVCVAENYFGVEFTSDPDPIEVHEVE